MTKKHRVADVGELKEGEMKEVEIGDNKILLILVKGKYAALGGTCPHRGAQLADGILHDERIRCPWHQAVFCASTGDLEEPPSLESLPRFEVRVEGDGIFVFVPEPFPKARQVEMVKPDPAADNRTFVIVGTGAAGMTAAETLRQEGYQGKIVMVTRESHLPYDRTDLSKPYLRKPDATKPFLRSEAFYKTHGIHVLTGREVTAVDAFSKTIQYQGGETQSYDRLLLATGARARSLGVPNEDLRNIFKLRSLDDCDRLRGRLDETANAVLVGASFICMEVAAALTERNISVTVVAPESIPFETVFGERIGRMYQALHEANGVRFRMGEKVRAFEGDGKVEGVTIQSGETLPADLVVVGIGVKPATDELDIPQKGEDGSLITDRFLRVSEELYAAGDIARFPDWRTGEGIRIEHWRVAQQQGRVAAGNMAGRDREYLDAPFFWTNQYMVVTDYIGYARGWDEVIFDGDPGEQRFVAYYVKENRVLASAICGEAKKMCLLGAILRAPEPPTVDRVRSELANL